MLQTSDRSPALQSFPFRSGRQGMTLSTWRVAVGFQAYLPASPDIDQIVIDIRTALWRVSKGRSAGVIDVAIAAAAAAVDADATVLHYDRDFDHIADVYPHLMAKWVVPRGSID
jgi:hypothetical protein